MERDRVRGRRSALLLACMGLTIASGLLAAEPSGSSTNAASAGTVGSMWSGPEGLRPVTRADMTPLQRSAFELRLSLIRDRVSLERSMTNASPQHSVGAAKEWEARNRQAMKQLGRLEQQVAVERAEKARETRLSGRASSGGSTAP